MYTVCKSYKFEGAHLLSSSKDSEDCLNIHGHSYKVEVFARAYNLNEESMVVNFAVLDDIVEPILHRFDHSLIYNWNDEKRAEVIIPLLEECKMKLTPMKGNPTAELMARTFFDSFYQVSIDRKIDSNVTISKVRVWETEKGYAEFEGA